MTKRTYKCIDEFRKDGVPYGMVGACMNLRQWLMITGKFDPLYGEISDRTLIEYMLDERGKVLIEVC